MKSDGSTTGKGFKINFQRAVPLEPSTTSTTTVLTDVTESESTTTAMTELSETPGADEPAKTSSSGKHTQQNFCDCFHCKVSLMVEKGAEWIMKNSTRE